MGNKDYQIVVIKEKLWIRDGWLDSVMDLLKDVWDIKMDTSSIQACTP